MAEKEDFLSFDKALKELKLKDEELRRLVSEGEIRAFRDGERMKFRREDVDRLKKDTGKTIQFTEESGDTLTDDLLFDEDDLKLGDDAGMRTAQISNEDTFIDEKKKAQSTAATSKKPQSEPRKAQGKSTSSTSIRSSTSSSSSASVRRTSTRSQTMVKPTRAPGEISMLGMVAIMVTTLVMLWGVAFVKDVSEGRSGAITKGLSESAEKWFSEQSYPSAEANR